MSNRHFFKLPFKYSQRQPVIATSLSILSLLVANVVQAEDICTVYAVDDAGLNNSNILAIDIPIAQPEEDGPPLVFPALPAGATARLVAQHPGADLEAMDFMGNDLETAKLYLASGDDATGKYAPGMLYEMNAVGGLKDIGQICVEEIGCLAEVDGLTFREQEPDALWGWAQDAGLFMVKPANVEDAELVLWARGEFEDLAWNFDGTVLYAVENDHDIGNALPHVSLTPPPVDGEPTQYIPNTVGAPDDHPYVYTTDEVPHLPDPGLSEDYKNGQVFWRYVPSAPEGKKIKELECNFNSKINTCNVEIESLDALPLPAGQDSTFDWLVVGYHKCDSNSLSIAPVKVDAAGNCTVVSMGNEIAVDFSEAIKGRADLEGIAWPCNPWPPLLDECPNELPNYAKDANDDGTYIEEPNPPAKVGGPVIVGGAMGDNQFELYGLAVREFFDSEAEQRRVTIAINSDMPLGGFISKNKYVDKNHSDSEGYPKRYLNAGDIIIEVEDGNGETSLYGVHFDANNDTAMHTGHLAVGLYKITETAHTSRSNLGWSKIRSYIAKVEKAGHDHSFAHADDSESSFFDFNAYSPAPTSIGGIEYNVADDEDIDFKVLENKAEVEQYSKADADDENFIVFEEGTQDVIQDMEFNEGDFNPDDVHTYGVTFMRPAEWGDVVKYRAHLFMECGNDGIAIEGEFCPPEV